MKKILFLLLTAFISAAFCACGNGSNVADKTSPTEIEESTVKNTETTEKSDNIITIKIGGEVFTARLDDNESAKAFADMLPLSLNMNELNGNEKYYYLGNALPTDSSDIGIIENGDIMLYGRDCIVLFYDSFQTQYSYTEIGHIENPANLADAVGSGDILITFEK